MLDGDRLRHVVFVESAHVRSHILRKSIVERGDELVIPTASIHSGQRLEVLEQTTNLLLVLKALVLLGLLCKLLRHILICTVFHVHLLLGDPRVHRREAAHWERHHRALHSRHHWLAWHRRHRRRLHCAEHAARLPEQIARTGLESLGAT